MGCVTLSLVSIRSEERNPAEAEKANKDILGRYIETFRCLPWGAVGEKMKGDGGQMDFVFA